MSKPPSAVGDDGRNRAIPLVETNPIPPWPSTANHTLNAPLNTNLCVLAGECENMEDAGKATKETREPRPTIDLPDNKRTQEESSLAKGPHSIMEEAMPSNISEGHALQLGQITSAGIATGETNYNKRGHALEAEPSLHQQSYKEHLLEKGKLPHQGNYNVEAVAHIDEDDRISDANPRAEAPERRKC